MTVRWITPTLGTAGWGEQEGAGADAVVDARVLRDASGNSRTLLAEKIAEIEASVRAGRRTLVCCDHGMSRSNALAAAALARIGNGDFSAALERVVLATGERAIKLDLLTEVRAAVGEARTQNTRRDDTHVLLGGADGFIGRAVQDALMRSGVQVTTGDAQAIRGGPAVLEQTVRSSGAGCVVLLVRPPVLNSNDGLGELLSQLRGVLEVCRACALRLIFLSGHQVYAGYYGAELRPDEDLPVRPADAVGEAFYLAERMIELHGERDGVEALAVRSCTLYGPGDRRPGFLRTFVQQALRGQEIVTHRYRNGLPVIELLHVRDFAAGIALAVRQRLAGRLHLGSGQGITTLALAQTVARLAGLTSPVRCVDLPGESASVILDCSRARAVLGWAAETALEVGLSELIADQRPLGTISGVIQP